MILNGTSISQMITTFFLKFVTVLISSAGFMLSVVAHCITAMLPFTQRHSETTLIRSPTAATVSSDKEVSPSEVIVSLFRLDNHTQELSAPIAVRRRPRHGSAPPMMIHASPPATVSMAADVNNPLLHSSPAVIEYSDDQYQANQICEMLEASQCSPTSHKPNLIKRLPTVFWRHRKSDDIQSCSSKSSRPSTPTSATSPGRSRSLTKCEAEEPADAHGRIPYVPNPDDSETLRTTFVNPLKFKRTSTSPSPASTPRSRTLDLPSVPDSPSRSSLPKHRRHRSLVSFLHSAVRPAAHTSADSRSSSPHRGSFSSYSTTSSSASGSSSPSSASASRRSFSFSSPSGENERETAKRTQPYGPPYYAAMPIPRIQRSTSRKTRTASVKPISEDWEPTECTEHGVVGPRGAHQVLTTAIVGGTGAVR